jgi:hypothetical protein
MQKLPELNQSILADIGNENRKHHKKYAEELMEVLAQCKDNQQAGPLLANTFYNLSKLSNNYRHIHIALQFKEPGVEHVKWNLQMLALASSRGRFYLPVTQPPGSLHRGLSAHRGNPHPHREPPPRA